MLLLAEWLESFSTASRLGRHYLVFESLGTLSGARWGAALLSAFIRDGWSGLRRELAMSPDKNLLTDVLGFVGIPRECQ
jgi:hypothetical protein